MSYTLRQLIEHYRTDQDLRFAKLKYQVRLKQDRLLTRIDEEYGHQQLRGIRARTLYPGMRFGHQAARLRLRTS